jgi:hypothetical protein
MCVGVDWKGLRCILTCYGFKSTQSHQFTWIDVKTRTLITGK